MNVLIRFLAPDFAVAPQLQPEHMAQLAAQGFRSVVNNRLEHEPGQPPQEAMREAAEAAGLEYEWQPVHPAMISTQDVSQFADIIDRLTRPTLAFCRSGTRSSTLFQAAAGTRSARN